MTANSYTRPHSWRVRVLDAAAASSDASRNARAWAAGWTPPGYALYARNVAAYVRHNTLPVDSASESGHIPQQTAA